MQIHGEITVNAPSDELFRLVSEPTKPAGGILGCQDVTETGEGDYAATFTARLSAQQLTLKGTVRLEGAEPSTRIAARATGNPTTPAGKLNGVSNPTLRAKDQMRLLRVMQLT